jgi:hypothetical protein
MARLGAMPNSNVGRRGPIRQATLPGSCLLQCPQLTRGELELFEDVVGSAQQQLSRLGEPERVMTVRSLDQPLADKLLERSDLLADRRLRKAEPRRSASERSLFGDRPERDQMPELDPEPSRINHLRLVRPG